MAFLRNYRKNSVHWTNKVINFSKKDKPIIFILLSEEEAQTGEKEISLQ